ncbi:hypothetical protein PsorP6_004603 [Peronosclerospora sorghi]|uniref:Uncharacterized protein n=1 Tax=Peronosclerospora sorghi TaxID=230839 RepID=A0ACC0VP58_9STRA|nr:hypothetical protein PsorP6_004603 [Peronosclerospora sorghi]
MLRVVPTTSPHRSESSDEQEESVAVAVGVDVLLSRTEEKDKEPLREIEDEFLWLLLLAAVAECVTTCYIPGYTLRKWELNVFGTLLNWIGSLLDGFSYGYEDSWNHPEKSGTKTYTWTFHDSACDKKRDAVDRVFTSYSFMVDHAGDLSSRSFAAGPLYVCASIGGGCGFFYLGKQVAATAWMHTTIVGVCQVVGAIKIFSSLATWLAFFVGLTTLRAVLGPHGFVRYVKLETDLWI